MIVAAMKGHQPGKLAAFLFDGLQKQMQKQMHL